MSSLYGKFAIILAANFLKIPQKIAMTIKLKTRHTILFLVVDNNPKKLQNNLPKRHIMTHK